MQLEQEVDNSDLNNQANNQRWTHLPFIFNDGTNVDSLCAVNITATSVDFRHLLLGVQAERQHGSAGSTLTVH